MSGEYSVLCYAYLLCLFCVNVVHGKLFGQSMVCGCGMGKSLVCIGYVSSFTLCWLSLLPGRFKGFIGKVLYPPFLLWGALV